MGIHRYINARYRNGDLISVIILVPSVTTLHLLVHIFFSIFCGHPPPYKFKFLWVGRYLTVTPVKQTQRQLGVTVE